MIRKRKDGFWDKVSRWFLYKLVEFLKGIRNELYVIAENTTPRKIVENIRAYVHSITQAPYDGKLAVTSWGGNSIVWNQLIYRPAATATATIRGVTFTLSTNGALTATGTGASSGGRNEYNFLAAKNTDDPTKPVSLVNNHIYLLTAFDGLFFLQNSGSILMQLHANTPEKYTGTDGTCTHIGYNTDQGRAYDYTGYLNLYDLTVMFGSGNEPESAAAFMALIPPGPSEHDGGTLKNMSVTDMLHGTTHHYVPDAVKALTGYGMATATKSNTVFWDDANSKWWYYQNVGLDADTGLPIDLNEPVITDITSLMTDFVKDFEGVKAGDTLKFLNSNGDGFRLPVPATLEYYIKGGIPNA